MYIHIFTYDFPIIIRHDAQITKCSLISIFGTEPLALLGEQDGLRQRLFQGPTNCGPKEIIGGETIHLPTIMIATGNKMEDFATNQHFMAVYIAADSSLHLIKSVYFMTLFIHNLVYNVVE